jgi:nucleotide-binding universal stress UspA family protein
MADKILLIGSSLDAESDAVVRAGLAWARAEGAKVHVAHAFTPPIGVPPLGVGGLGLPSVTDAFLMEQEEQIRGLLAEQIQRVGLSPDELAGSSVVSGSPHRALADLAAELGAGLLVVGATAGGRIQRLLGSTADRVIRRAICPVLVVRGELPMPPARVLSPVDLSPLSGSAFRTALERLGELPGNVPEIAALFVLTPIQRQVSPQFTPEQIDRFAQDELERFVTAHAGDAARGRVRCQVRVGTIREEILEEIETWRPDLVALGTHGLGGFDRLAIGSIAADVLREAPCSVLVVPAADQS